MSKKDILEKMILDTYFLCAWDKEGSHLNYGKSDENEESFIEKILNI